MSAEAFALLCFRFQAHDLIFGLAKNRGLHLEFCLGFKFQSPPILNASPLSDRFP